MADFARMPTRQKVMVFAVIGILLGLLYWQFVFKGLKEDIAAAEGENASQSGLNKKLEKDIPEYQKLKTRMITLNKIIDENQKALPSEAELPAFFETLNRKVLESGVEVVRSRQGAEQRIETFVKVPIEYEIQGTFLQIKKFFASLLPKREKAETDPNAAGAQVEERERIVSIENLSLTNPIIRNREIRLTAKFTASTFRQEEATANATAKKAPAPAKAPAAPAQAPAATPTGARQRTEGALDKADQRASGAAKVDEAKPAGSGTDRMKGGL
ncbi:MAG: type 4a pilus biogenesis protein PilO [Kofleriaceae bacterium]|nr:type 4a pilus biogenesis protein PilO [Kofleriaceae bacterium]